MAEVIIYHFEKNIKASILGSLSSLPLGEASCCVVRIQTASPIDPLDETATLVNSLAETS